MACKRLLIITSFLAASSQLLSPVWAGSSDLAKAWAVCKILGQFSLSILAYNAVCTGGWKQPMSRFRMVPFLILATLAVTLTPAGIMYDLSAPLFRWCANCSGGCISSLPWLESLLWVGVWVVCFLFWLVGVAAMLLGVGFVLLGTGRSKNLYLNGFVVPPPPSFPFAFS